MRPPDENQHGFTRPNLLSGARRRFGNYDNILERLERDSARQASGNRSRAAWYVAAASLVLLVLVVVAWMAYENAGAVQVIPMTRASAERIAALAPSTPPDTAPAPSPLPVHAPLPGAATVLQMDPHDAAIATQAAIVRPAPVHNSMIASVPPLVLLPGDAARDHKPPLSAKADAPVPAVAAGRAKPMARSTPPAQQQAAPARQAPRAAVAARPRRAADTNLPHEALVDRDVALLSAIIMHDSAHAEEKAQVEAASACARASERKCAGRTTSAQK